MPAIAEEQRGPAAKAPVSLRRRALSAPTLISFVLALAVIFFLLTRFQIDLGATWDHIRHSNLGLYLAALVLYYLSFPVRGLRWLILLKNAQVGQDAPAKPPSAWACAEMIFLAWFANAVTWFRLGDAYRGYLLTQRSGASFSRTMGTVVAERVLDMASVFILLVVAAVAAWGIGDLAHNWGILAAALGMALLGILGLLAMYLLGNRLARRLPRRVQGIYARFQEGTFGSFRQLPLVVLLSLVGWLLEVARLQFVLYALGFNVGFPLVLFVAMTHSLVTTIPFTPGGLGLAETSIAGLLSTTLAPAQAVSAAILDRSIVYLSVVVFGLLLFAVRAVRKPVSGPAGARSKTPGDRSSTGEHA